MKGRGIIAKVFGVSKNTVTLWKEMDAPIYQIGRSLQANYIELWAWLIKMHCQSENLSSPLMGPGRDPDETRTGVPV